MTISCVQSVGVVLAILQPGQSPVNKSVQPLPLNAKKAWTILSAPAKANVAELTRATLTIVRAGDKHSVNKLMNYIEQPAYLRVFAYPKRRTRKLETYPFSRLVNRIAQCDSRVAELVILRIANSDTVSGKLHGGAPQRYERGIAIVMALGYLQPKTGETYGILEEGIRDTLNMSSAIALESLVRIGNAQAAKVILSNLFRRPRDWTTSRFAYNLEELGKGRDRPAIFGALLNLVGKAKEANTKAQVLHTLIDKKSIPNKPHDTVWMFPDYQSVTKETCTELLRLVTAVETKDFDKISLDLLLQLKNKLTRPAKKPR